MKSSVAGFSCLAIYAAAVLSLVSAQAAEWHTEDFSAGLSGWLTEGPVMAVPDGGSIRLDVTPQLVPAVARFTATNTSSSGSFAGDYQAATGQLFGFSFMAVDVLP
ncbi:MAG: hypothetical protein KJ626_03380, partial [Verrucomicrobia bacterium]|nr:hypothetical protein [Verrucomicrobiota bacterium]